MATDQPLTFAALLRHYRMAAGLSQEALAERAGLSVRAISDLERGERRRPYLHTVQQLAAALRGYLSTKTEDSSPRSILIQYVQACGR